MGDSDVRIPGIQKVDRRGKRHWQVMHAKKYFGFFSAFDDALQVKAKAMGLTAADLKRRYMKSSTSCQEPVEYKEEPAMYKGITRIKRAGKLWWQAQDTTNKQYIGIADTVAGATALLESHHGEAPAQRARNQWYSRDRQVEHFKELSDIYTDQHGNPILPSDVGASIDMELQYPDLASEAPALFYIATMAKHGPFKKTVGLRWAEVYSKHAVESEAMKPMKSLKLVNSKKSTLSLRSLKDVQQLRDADLDCMIQLLQIVAYDILDIDFSIWNRNVGHGNSFYSGPFLMMRRFLGVIVSDENTYAPCQQCDYQACREKLRAAHHAGLVLNKMPVEHGLTLSAYSTFAQNATGILAALHPPGLSPDGKYSIPWLLRARLLAAMGAKSMKSLEVMESDSLDLVKKSFPDAKEWLELYCKGTVSVSVLVNELNYKHGIELMTAFFCLFGDREVLTYSNDYLKKHKDAIKRKLREYIKEHDVTPHPAILLKEFAEATKPIKRPAVAQLHGNGLMMKRPARSS